MQFAGTKHGTKNTFWLFEIDIQIDTPLLTATAKTTTCAKISQIGRKQLWMEYFDQVKSNPTYSIIIAKHAHGKVWNCFLSIFLHFSRVKFIIIWSIYLKLPVGQSRKFRSACWLTFSIVLDSLSNDRGIKYLTPDRPNFLCWVVEASGVVNYLRDAERSFSIALNNSRVYVSQ